MKTKPRNPLVPALVCVALVAFLALALVRQHRRALGLAAAEKARHEQAPASRAALAAAARKAGANALAAEARRATKAALAEKLSAHLDDDTMRAREVSLAFNDLNALRRFLARAGDAGLTVLASSDALLSARVRYESVGALAGELVDNAGDYAEVGGNFIAVIPDVPRLDEREARAQVPVRDHLLAAVGAAGMDNSQWGRGVTIAVLDTGVAADAISGRLRALDIGLGLAPEPGFVHGTAVASIAAGESARTPGIAPAADILSIRVTDADGVSDMFTIAQAILMAADNGAQIINISLGGYGGSAVLSRAIEYALQAGSIVVAAAGNDQASRLAWPAADKNTASVGATDLLQQQMLFSNSGPQLGLTAPGCQILVALPDGEMISFTGTSASAPVVAAAIAALMSESPGMTSRQALDILLAHADDAGPLGRDDDYGAGVVDLGWAMERDDPTRVDTAISSHYYNAKDGTLDVVVQNRGATLMPGMTLMLEVNGAVSSVALPPVEAGAATVVKVPVPAGEQTTVRTTLVNPAGVADKDTSNNFKASVVTPPADGGK